MGLLNKKWIMREMHGAVPDGLHGNSHIAKLLFARGIDTEKKVEEFFFPKLEILHDPFLMKDMKKAVKRVTEALKKKEKILVYGDYDVDGATAVALVYSFLEKQGASLGFFVPDRYVDGYGLSTRGVDFAAAEGYSLMIVLDCGIKNNEEIAYANEKGIDVIIGDHHQPGDTLPDAYAILDPKCDNDKYPYKELSGCGVGFKFIQAFSIKHNLNVREMVYPFLDLVAISIAADVVPLTDENRILSYFGLMLVNTMPRPGVEALLSYSKVEHVKRSTKLASGTNRPTYFNKELTSNDLVFMIGPRINAAGRMESEEGQKSARLAVELLLAKDIEQAKEIAESINKFNTERKMLDSQATEDALKQLEQNPLMQGRNTTVVYDKSWNQGIVGIVASRLTETYYRPTVVFTESKKGDMLVGSARSVGGFDIYSAIERCWLFLQHFGGHKYATGLSILHHDLEPFAQAFEDIVTQMLKDDGQTLVPTITIDDDLDFSEITFEFYRELKRFLPFGAQNTNPIFRTNKVLDTGYSRKVGKNHLKLSLFQQDKHSFPINAIAFGQGDLFETIKSGVPFNICYEITENEWNGVVSIQLNIKDIQFER
ncbi:MAG: single-stranded-DNA-specific exonuclease RecJ [Bacteroidales bacterium]|jgi:single-stranded-DNA-specific exonuclease|nr:single-stranded-DNA-specific exonuclease RecJ [Bacteroidales bacterium]